MIRTIIFLKNLHKNTEQKKDVLVIILLQETKNSKRQKQNVKCHTRHEES